MSRRFLITGATGFVGSHLCRALDQPSDRILKIGLRESAPDMEIVDISDASAVEQIVKLFKPTHVIHLAAQSSVASASTDRLQTWTVNVAGTLNLGLAVARYAPDAIFLFASSAEVYGASFLCGRLNESAPLLPLNEYGKSKRLAEEVLTSILPPRIKLIIARPFNHSGRGQREAFVLPSFASQIARIEKGLQSRELRVGNTEVRRDFLHVSDVVQAYICLLSKADDLPSPFICNVASDKSFSIRDLIERMQVAARVSFDIVVDPVRVRTIDVPVVSGDARLLRSITGWVPKIDIDSLLEELIIEQRNI